MRALAQGVGSRRPLLLYLGTEVRFPHLHNVAPPGCCSGARSGDGGFTLACISGRSGVVGFNIATSPRPVREKVRPARSKHSKFDVFEVAGRILSRVEWGRGRAGRILSRLSALPPSPEQFLARHYPGPPPSPEQFLARHYPGPAAAHRHRGLARRHSNFACNSPAACSNIEFASLELQRFLGLLKFGPIELHAKSVWLGSCCRLSNFARNSPAACSNIEFASLGLQRFRVVSKSDRAKLCAKFFWRWPCEPVLALPTGRLHRALAFRPPDPPDPSGPSGSFGALHAGGAWCVVLAHSISASRSVQNSPCSASWW